MIITKTPFRVSFFGGGTDYHTWYQEYGGSVLSASIDHYCYLTCRYVAPFFEHKSRVVWSEIEQVINHADVRHPAVRAILNYLKIENGIEIHHQGDLPARSGLGSSSAFSVGLLNALHGLNGCGSTKRQLACEAVHVERTLLKENVGVQDQIATAFGGLNKIDIYSDGDFSVNPVILPINRLEELRSHLLLFFTGFSRNASDIAGQKIKAIQNKVSTLKEMHEMVDIGLNILVENNDIRDFGRLLHESWLLKQSIAKEIAPEPITKIYSRAMEAGAIGGKLLGAGGGGFMLIFADPEKQPAVLNALHDLLLVPFNFEKHGSQIIFHDQDQRFTESSMARRDFYHLPSNAKNATQKEYKEPITRQTKICLV